MKKWRHLIQMPGGPPVLLLALVVIMSGFSGQAWAQAPSPLDGYACTADGPVNALTVQEDGKALVGGAFTHINGVACNRLARLNIDGSLDSTFAPGAGANGEVYTIVVQEDGKVLVGGDFTSISLQASGRIARFCSDGTLDTSFTPGTGADDKVWCLAVQEDGKILVCGAFTHINGVACNRIARLNADGSLDTTFKPGTGADGLVRVLALQPDGRVLLGGLFTQFNGAACKSLARLNADGSLDFIFNPGLGAGAEVHALAVQEDGKILLGGIFSNVHDIVCKNIARLNPDGSLDASFAPGAGANGDVCTLAVQCDGKVLLGGEFTSVSLATCNRIARLYSDGSLDTTFAPNGGADGDVCTLAVQCDGKVLVGGEFTSISLTACSRIARLTAEGSHDCDFNPGPGPNNNVYALAVQPDGKALVGGAFTQINGIVRNRLARLNAKGALDTSFSIGLGANGLVWCLAAQCDGKVLVGGAFTSINSVACNRLARLNADGSLDTSFTLGAGANNDVCALAVQPDGKVLVGGYFTSINGIARNRLARLNADGSLDTSFTLGSGSDGPILAIAVQADGKIVLGGMFSSINGTARGSMARLNADGSLDTTFAPRLTPDGEVHALAVQLDGKIVLGGDRFVMIDRTRCHNLARLNPDGSLDTTFDPGTGANKTVYTLMVQADGKVLVGGAFDSVDSKGPAGFARLNPDGTLDTTFDHGKGTNDTVWCMTGQCDGDVLLGGAFSDLNGTARNRLARLSNTCEAHQALTVATDGGCVTWTLGGAFPQPCQVLFEQAAGGTWTPLGWGEAVPGVGYRLSGLHLPLRTNQSLRATGWVTSGAGSGAASLHRSVLRTYTGPVQCTMIYIAGANGSINGAPSVTQMVDQGTSGTTVTAQPNTGYHFVQWSDAATANPRIDTNVVTSQNITASFAINQYTLRYIAGANGSIDGATSVTQTVAHGTNAATVTAVPATGYHFFMWSDGLLTASRTDTNVTAHQIVTAVFVINQYTVTFRTDGTAGATLAGTATQTINHGSNCSPVTAQAPSGYHFVKWTSGGADYSTSNPLTVTNVTGSMTLTAVFMRDMAVEKWTVFE